MCYLYHCIFTPLWLCIYHSHYSCINKSSCLVFSRCCRPWQCSRCPYQTAGHSLPPFPCRNSFVCWPSQAWRRQGQSIFKASALWPMLSISWNVRLSVRLPVRLSVRLPVSLSVRRSIRVFTFEVPFNRLFASTSQSQMSNIFKNSESLGKSIIKKWSQIWKFLRGSSLKLPNNKKKKNILADFVLQNKVETTLSDVLETSVQRTYR